MEPPDGPASTPSDFERFGPPPPDTAPDQSATPAPPPTTVTGTGFSDLLDDRSARMVLSAIVEPGDSDVDDLVEAEGAPETVRAVWSGDLPDRVSLLTRASVERHASPHVLADEMHRLTAACGSRVLVPSDDDWPDQLSDLYAISDESQPHMRPPRCLWVRGELSLTEFLDRAVSIVGSRACTEYGSLAAENMAFELAEAGWTIVSGGAYGIDRAAHQGALSAHSPTVSVLACGVDQGYPQGNERLFTKIADTGLLLSEWPPGFSPRRHRFLTRNRVIAALTRGTIVVEAASRSGARHTARLAAELDRTLMFVPGPITSASSAGVHQMARECWEPRLVTSAADVIADLAPFEAVAEPDSSADDRPMDRLDEADARVVEVLRRGWVRETAAVASDAGLPVAETAKVLERLASTGWVQCVEGRWRLPVDR
ncbi:DNA-processing protein DprA [Salininema proteolyticum]|uniref:DNA-processing protein DprA n=1 Tax=Salininema proteolyticum TaxID=1607685 RepID=A0ABV8U1I9_9ACTN